MAERKEYSLKLTYKVNGRYPTMGEFVALMQDDDCHYTVCPRDMLSDEDMEGVFLGHVKENPFYSEDNKKEPIVTVGVCQSSVNLNDIDIDDISTFSTVDLPADKLVVLDVMVGNDTTNLEFSSTQFEGLGFYAWICENDTESGKYINFLAFKEITERYYELCKQPLPRIFLTDINLTDNPTPNVKTTTARDDYIREYLHKTLPNEKLTEYSIQKSFVENIESLCVVHPYLMNNGIAMRIVVKSDLLFRYIPNDENIYVHNFAREFMVASAYLGTDITVVCNNVPLCRDMLNAADIPYHNVTTPTLTISEYNYTCINEHCFEGFVSVFSTLFKTILLDFQNLVGFTYDEQKRTLDNLYSSSFQYSSQMLNDIINHIKTTK